MAQQGSLFSKVYRPLAQQYFSAGPLPPSSVSTSWGGGASTSMFTLGGPLPCSLGGVHFHVHFWGGGSTSMLILGGGPLPCSLLGGVHFCVHFWGGVHFYVHFWGGSLLCSLLGGSHMTYPIMLLYTAIECPSASWAKFTWDPPPPHKELDRLTDRQTLVKTLPSRTTCAGGNNNSYHVNNVTQLC